MSSPNEFNQARVISELRQFIKKLLLSPGTLEQTIDIMRRHTGEADMMQKTAHDISAETMVKIPDDASEWSDADRLYLELLKEVVEEEQALY